MFAHNVINQINRYLQHAPQQVTNDFKNELSTMMKLMYMSSQYHIGNYMSMFHSLVQPMLKKHADENNNEDIKPFATPGLLNYTKTPYPITWIDGFVDEENINKRGLLLYTQANILTIYSSFCKDNLWCVNPYIGILTFDKNNVLEVMHVKMTNRYDEATLHEEVLTEIKEMVKIAYLLLWVINSRNITIIEKEPSRLMTRITNKNKCRPFTYKVLKITNNVTRYESKREGTYVVKGIRPLHEVMGHERKYKSGIKRWIKEHDRGDCRNGIMEKEYVFVNGVQHKRTKKVMKGGV